MKVRIFVATLAITMLMGVQGFAMSPCDSACVDPCAACDRGVVKGNLFTGLKRLVNGVRANNCDPCDAVVACNPCDEAAFCDPCDPCGFDNGCSTPRFGLGGRLRNLFASNGCDPCGPLTDCLPCDPRGIDCEPCDPCGFDDGCGRPKFQFRGLFSGLRLNRGCATDCGPCDYVDNCGPCDDLRDCGPCDYACNGDAYCGPRGHLIDLPRFNLGRLFSRISRCNTGCDDNGFCGPCDGVKPCDSIFCR